MTAFRARLSLDNTPYFAVHIRRGDKGFEAPSIPTINYVSKINEVNERRLTTCFAMSDDFDAIAGLRRDCPHLNIVSLADVGDAGHLQNSFNAQPPEVRREKTIRLIAELEIAAGCAFFVGTYSSNIGRVIALMRGRDTIFTLDGPPRLIGTG